MGDVGGNCNGVGDDNGAVMGTVGTSAPASSHVVCAVSMVARPLAVGPVALALMARPGTAVVETPKAVPPLGREERGGDGCEREGVGVRGGRAGVTMDGRTDGGGGGVVAGR